MDTKVSALSAAASAAGTDILLIITDPGGTPASKKITVANLFTSPTLITPTIASFANALHDHTNGVGGGQLNASSVFSAGSVPAARGGFGADVSGSSGVPLFAAGVPTFTGTSGTGNFARATSPTFVTPVLGAASATSLDTPVLNPTGNIIEQRNGANSQTLRIYGTFTDASNYERLNISPTTIQTTAAGTGTPRNLTFGTIGNSRIDFTANNTTYAQLQSDGTFKSLGQIQQTAAPNSVSGSVTVNFATGNIQRLTLTGNVTSLTLSNAKDGAMYVLTIIQDATGSRTVTWGSNVKWAGGVAPTLTTTAGARDQFWFSSDGTSIYELSRSLDVK